MMVCVVVDSALYHVRFIHHCAIFSGKVLKASVFFSGRTHLTTTTGVCRFCGSTSDNGQLAVSNVCSDPACQENAAIVSRLSYVINLSIFSMLKITALQLPVDGIALS